MCIKILSYNVQDILIVFVLMSEPMSVLMSELMSKDLFSHQRDIQLYTSDCL